MGRSTVQAHLVTNTEYGLKANTKFADLVKIVYLVRLTYIAKALKVFCSKRFAVVKYFESIGILNEADTFGTRILSVLKKLINEVRFVCVELDNSFQGSSEHSVLILSYLDYFSDIAHF